MTRSIKLLILCFSAITILPATSYSSDGRAIVEKSFNYMRGKTSFSIVRMTIHRPDWERTMEMKVWTRGQDESFLLTTSPSRDRGNATLKKGREMWIFNPKVSRTIKLPPSMMSRSWMGSDFSNNDLSKTDSIINDYTHTVTGTDTQNGVKVYLIKSVPLPDAPVIWGLQKLKIREDGIFLRQEFYDEDFVLVKYMQTQKIKIMGGKPFPEIWDMWDAEEDDKYTRLHYEELQFDLKVKNSIFTLSSLKNPGRR